MNLGLIVILIIVVGISVALCMLFLARQNRSVTVKDQAGPPETLPADAVFSSPGPQGDQRAQSGPPTEEPEPAAAQSPMDDSHFLEIEIHKVPIYQETRAPMHVLNTNLDQFVEILEEIIRPSGSAFAADDATVAAFENAVPKLHQTLVGARAEAEKVLAIVENQPGGPTDIEDPLPVDLAVTLSPSARGESPRASVARTLKRLSETVRNSRPHMAGFYFSLTKPDEVARTIEASCQMTLLIENLNMALAYIAEFEKKSMATDA